LKGDVVIENVTWLLTYTINVKIFLTNDWVSYISHLWTLAVEEQFYIFFPLVIFLVPLKKLPALLISIIVLSMVSKNLYYFLYPDKVIASATFPLHSFDSLCMGALFSYVAKYHYDRFRKYLDMLIFWRLLLALFFYLLVFYYVDAPSYPVNNYVTRTVLAFVFSFLCMYLVGKAGTIGFKGIWGKMLDSAALVYIGKISYGIYLYHNFVPVLLNVVKIKTGISYNHIPTLPLVYLVVTIVLASLSWHLVERPINSLKDKFNYSS
jgi:peptidoglycan/LPS O-acetylase OafA/YrhL